MARLGIGILIIPQKPWEVVAAELQTYTATYREVNGEEPPAPIAAGWVFCDEDAGRAEELARRYIGGYWQSVIEHYELKGDHLAKTKGYESYGQLQNLVSADGGSDAATEFFLNLQIWGTPEQCYEKIIDVQKRIGGRTFNGIFSFAGMPSAEAERNLRLFAEQVRPELARFEL
jgi:alkanesulfonate monooxygenase SsuD/methylene tetrahydromethanopterin reductase-like flavin-dependent oxidoreductase (luciferase family)